MGRTLISVLGEVYDKHLRQGLRLRLSNALHVEEAGLETVHYLGL